MPCASGSCGDSGTLGSSAELGFAPEIRQPVYEAETGMSGLGGLGALRGRSLEMSPGGFAQAVSDFRGVLGRHPTIDIVVQPVFGGSTAAECGAGLFGCWDPDEQADESEPEQPKHAEPRVGATGVAVCCKFKNKATGEEKSEQANCENPNDIPGCCEHLRPADMADNGSFLGPCPPATVGVAAPERSPGTVPIGGNGPPEDDDLPEPFCPPECDSLVCGPNITDALVQHYNDVLLRQEFESILPSTWADALAGYTIYETARNNARMIRNTARAVQGCPVGTPCSGTFTLCDLCFPADNLDHLLGVFYLVTSYSEFITGLAGLTNETFSRTPLSDRLTDMTTNALAFCFASKTASRWSWAAWWGQGVDRITREEMCECVKDLDWLQRHLITKMDAYYGCELCDIPVRLPSGLVLPKFYRYMGAFRPARPAPP